MAFDGQRSDEFSEMKQRTDLLRQRLEEEGREATTSSRMFRKAIIEWMTLLTGMIAFIYEYLRAQAAEEKEQNGISIFSGAKELVESVTPVRLSDKSVVRQKGGNGQVVVLDEEAVPEKV